MVYTISASLSDNDWKIFAERRGLALKEVLKGNTALAESKECLEIKYKKLKTELDELKIKCHKLESGYEQSQEELQIYKETYKKTTTLVDELEDVLTEDKPRIVNATEDTT